MIPKRQKITTPHPGRVPPGTRPGLLFVADSGIIYFFDRLLWIRRYDVRPHTPGSKPAARGIFTACRTHIRSIGKAVHYKMQTAKTGPGFCTKAWAGH